MTLSDALDSLYDKYGFSLEKTCESVFSGYDGAERMKALMSSLRARPITSIAGRKVISVSDYLTGVVTNLEDGTTLPTGLPSSDVLRWELEGSDVIVVRPSGTEPKLKIYYLLSGSDEKSSSEKLANYQSAIAEITGIM